MCCMPVRLYENSYIVFRRVIIYHLYIYIYNNVHILYLQREPKGGTMEAGIYRIHGIRVHLTIYASFTVKRKKKK